MTYVKNVNGTSKPRYAIPNLTQKYEKSGGVHTKVCQATNCHKPATATAHVISASSGSREWMATRTCASHNHTTNKTSYNVAPKSLIPLKKIKK
jgi:hypothetical protein